MPDDRDHPGENRTMSDTTAAIRATTLGCSLTCKDLDASIRFYRDAIARR